MAALAHPNPTLNLPQTALFHNETDPRVSDRNDTATYLKQLHGYVFESIQSLRLSQIRALDSAFATFDLQLDGLGQLAEGWDGYDAPVPSAEAIRSGREILRRLQEELLVPNWVSASADGGVAFSFAAPGNRRAQIEVLNNGEKFAHLYDLTGNSHTEDWAGTAQNKPFKELLEPVLHYIYP